MNEISRFFPGFCRYSLAVSVGFMVLSLHATTWSVDQQLGDDVSAAADPTGSTPFLHLQKAIEVAASGETILVGDGVYGPDTEGVQTMTLGGKAVNSTLSVKSKFLTIKSRNGAAKTILEGRLDGGSTGSVAVRCLFSYKAGGTGGKIAFEGFTLRNGGTATDSTSYDGRGGAAYAYEASGTPGGIVLINCIVTNCHSHIYGAASACTLVGCQVRNCHGYAGASGLYDGRAFFTVFADNVGSNGTTKYPVTQLADLTACTFFGNTCNTEARGKDASTHSRAADSIFAGSLTTYIDTENIVTDKTGASLNAPAAGDYRPIAGGAADCAAGSTLPSDVLPSGYTWASVMDAAGYAIDPTALRVGAVQAAAGQVCVSAVNGGLTVVGAVIGTPVSLGPGEKIVISPSGVATRPCVGVAVNGETFFFDDLPESTYTVTAEQLDAAGRTGLVIEACYTNIWYLSPTGDDAASGFTAKTAKRNFAEVFASTAEGDVIQLAEGHYDSGEVMVSGKYRARAVVPRNRTVQGAGLGRTFIHGVVDNSSQAIDGCGAAAACCVYLSAGARVRCCTLTDGRSATDSSTGAIYGGGVSSANRQTTAVEMCIITNCVATRGGGANAVRLVNCLVTGCRGTQRAGGTYYCEHYNTAVVGNSSANEIVMYPYVLANSTVGGNTLSGSGAADVFVGALTGGAEFAMTNSLVVGTIKSSNDAVIGPLVNSYVAAVGTSSIAERASELTVKSIDELQIDARTGRPLLGKNAVIGQGDYAKYDRTLCGDWDIYGLPRVINGTLDIGALDADYGPVFLKAAGVRRGEALGYSDGVLYDEAAGRVTLADGAHLSFAWTHTADGPCKVRFDIPAGGAVTVTRNDESPVTVASGNEYAFDGRRAESDVLSVSYAGTDVASFAVEDVKCGLYLILH